MNAKTIHDIKIGDIAYSSKTITEQDIIAFASASGDFNPVHMDEVYAKSTFFGRRIAHGMLTASLISRVLGTQLPGVGTIYLSQEIKFVAPVYIQDTITATVEVVEIINQKKVRLKTMCVNQDGLLVLEGYACVLPPKDIPALL